VTLLVAAGCNGASSRNGAAAAARRSAATASTVPPATDPPTPSTTTTTLPPAPVDQPGWTIVSAAGSRVVSDTLTVVTPAGGRVTLVRFRAGTYRLDLHLGGSDPPSGGRAIPASAGYAVSPAERPQLLGVFNGGFKTSTGSGGFEADGQVFTPLVAGDASLVIDTGGQVHLGVWGQDVPLPGEQVSSVRQNLRPLVYNGQPSPAVNDVPAWGATLGGVARIARSAVGLDAGGDLVYAAGMYLLPADLSEALIGAGVQNAMELDINPYWVQADVAAYPGGPLTAAVPGQQRPASQYLSGWTRDFLTVLAAP
jgi:hypothetical protein